MSNTPRQLTRNLLTEFLPNQRAVRAFEQVLKQVGELLPADVASLNQLVQEAQIEGANASATAQAAVDALARLATVLELASLAPPRQDPLPPDDVAPPQALSLSSLADVQSAIPVAGSLLIYHATLRQYRNALLTEGANVTITNADGAVTITVAGAPPTGAAGGVLSGAYPNPGFAVDMATQAELDAHTGATGAAVHGLGTVATLTADTDGTLAANSDTRVATQKAVKTFVNAAVTGLLDFKGSTDCSSTPNYPAAAKGDAYVVSAAGKIGGASGVVVDVGDVYVASADNAGGTQAAVGTSWFILEHNLQGALLAANNLSDLTNAGTARTNLGLAIGSNVQAWDADLDAIAALTGASGLLKKTAANTWALDTSTYGAVSTGTWTATVTFDSGSITLVSTPLGASYIKIGTLVFVSVYIQMSDSGTGSGGMNIAGLPFTVNGVGAAAIGQEEYAVTKSIAGIVYPGSTNIYRIRYYDGTSVAASGSRRDFQISAVYQTT